MPASLQCATSPGTTLLPDYFQLKTGGFLEIGTVFLLASDSVEYLRNLQGGTALIDRRRFRTNLYIDTG